MTPSLLLLHTAHDPSCPDRSKRMEALQANVYTLVREWSEAKGLDPQLVLMSAGAATLLGA